jgi:hypothetical protein
MHFTETLSSNDRRDTHIDQENSVIYEERHWDRLKCHDTYNKFNNDLLKINKMDSQTQRAWGSHKPTLCKQGNKKEM